eukprot:jgi/Ulvmu1/4638/UM002_0369.1
MWVQVGNGGNLNYLERSRAHFGLWALLKAPLFIGADLRRIGEGHLHVLLAQEVIAISQDGLGVAGDLVYTHGAVQVFAAPLEGGARAVGVLYRQTHGAAANVTVAWERFGYPEHLPVSVRDVYAETTWKGLLSRELTVEVAPASLQLLRLIPQPDMICGQGAHLLDVVLDAPDKVGDSDMEMSCVNEDALNAWRPWDHGFFG